MGLFDLYRPNLGWLGNSIPQQQPTDIMNPYIYGDTSGHAPVGQLLNNLLEKILPPLNGGQQPGIGQILSTPVQASPYAQPQQQQSPMPDPNMGIPVSPQQQQPMSRAGLDERAYGSPAPQIPPNAAPAEGSIPPQIQQSSGFPNPLSFVGKALGGLGDVLNPTRGQLVDMGSDPYSGAKQYGIYDPVKKTLVPVGGGAPASGATASIQAALSLPPQYNQHGVDETFLSALDPTTRSVVTSILQGDSSVTPRNLQKFLPLATRAEQGFVGQTYQTRLNGMKDFYGGGKSSEVMRKANQSALHFGELVNDKMAALPSHSVPGANVVENFVKTNLLGSDAQGNFEVNAHALADELSSMFKGAGISDTEIRAWESRLTPNMSLEQQRGMAKTLLGLYRDSVTALEKKRQESVGPHVAAQKGPILGPEAEAALGSVERFTGGQHRSPTQSGGNVTKSGIKWNLQ